MRWIVLILVAVGFVGCSVPPRKLAEFVSVLECEQCLGSKTYYMISGARQDTQMIKVQVDLETAGDLTIMTTSIFKPGDELFDQMVCSYKGSDFQLHSVRQQDPDFSTLTLTPQLLTTGWQKVYTDMAIEYDFEYPSDQTALATSRTVAWRGDHVNIGTEAEEHYLVLNLRDSRKVQTVWLAGKAALKSLNVGMRFDKGKGLTSLNWNDWAGYHRFHVANQAEEVRIRDHWYPKE